MPWFKTQTLDIPSSGNAVTTLLSGSAPEVLVQAYDKAPRTGVFLACYGSIDGTNLSSTIDPGDALVFQDNGFGRLDAWPYINIVNIQAGTCKVDIYEWLEDEN